MSAISGLTRIPDTQEPTPIAMRISHSSRFRRSASVGLSLMLVVAAALNDAAVAGEAPATATIGHARCCGRQDVILIRGGAGYWPGAGDLANHFRRLGYAATVTNHWEYAEVADQIAAAVREGRMSGVVIVGYSSGADAACWMAESLNQHGIRVNTMILIESTFGTPVPDNVDYCVNYYESRTFDFIPAFRGVPVAAGRNTTLRNVNIAYDPDLRSLVHLNHFRLGDSPQLHGTLGNQVAARVSPNTSYAGESQPGPVMYARQPAGTRSAPARTADAFPSATSKIR